MNSEQIQADNERLAGENRKLASDNLRLKRANAHLTTTLGEYALEVRCLTEEINALRREKC